MGDKKIKFRSAMGGYNREAVNNYIESLSAKYYNAETDSQKRIAELEEQIKQMEEQLEEKKDVSLAEIEELKNKAEQAERLIAELNETIEKVNEEKVQLEKDNASLRESVLEYEKMNEVNSELYEKSNKYDKVSEQIGSMIVSASARAESIVSEAELKARVVSNAMIDAVLDKLNMVNEKYANEIVTKTVQLTEEMRALSLSAESFRTNTKAAVERDCLDIRESLESTKRIILEDNHE